jgi:hypothetical protein
MSTRNYIEELEYQDAKGLDTSSPINLLGPGYVRTAINVNLGVTGGYVKRDGYMQQFTNENALGGFAIRQGLEYRKRTTISAAPTVEILLYSTNNISGIGSIGGLGKISGGVFVPFTNKSNVTLNISTTKRPAFAQINNSLYVANGVDDPLVYEENGVFTRPLGIKYPVDINNELDTPSTSLMAYAGTDALNEGQYIYAYTYAFRSNFDNRLLAESSPSNTSEPLPTNALNKKITVTLQPFPDYGLQYLQHVTIYIRIWRTVVNGNILFLEKEIAGNSASYISDVPDAGLEAEQMPFDNTQLSEYDGYQEARFPTVSRNRLLMFHSRINRGRFSKIGIEGPLAESFPVQNEFSVEGKFGAADGMIGSGQIKGIPIILKERSIGRLEEIGLPDLGNSEDAVVYIYREISETVGAVSHFSQCQVFDELVFLGRDNVYATDGQNVRPIGSSIQSLIKASDFTNDKASKLSAINDTKNRRIYLTLFKDINSVEPDVILVGDYQQYPNFRWTTYEVGPDADMAGIKAGCFFQTEATADGGLDVYFGSATNEGQYYKMNQGGTDFKTSWNGVSATTSANKIYMRLISRPYMFGQPMVTKLYKIAKVYAEGRAQTYDFQFGALYDLNQTEVNVVSKTVPGVASTWNLFNWAPSSPLSTTMYWTGPALNEFKYHMHRKAQMMQFAFTQNDAEAPVTLLGWGISGSVFGGI